MLMADTMAIFFTVLGLLIALPGLWLLCRGLWPGSVESARSDCVKTLWKPFLVGIPITAGAIFLCAMLGKLPQPVGGILAILDICLFITYASAGVAGLATVVGERLPSPADAQCPWKATIRGGVILELSYLLPILGWFVLLPSSIIIGAGAVTRSFFAKKSPSSRTESGAKMEPLGDNIVGGPLSAPS
jgi:hypothetical protein